MKTKPRLLTVCASCERIRDKKGAWHRIDGVHGARPDLRLTHGICPECRAELYPELVTGPRPEVPGENGAGDPV